jgi:uncharacterized damage-inducible protein DinB
MKVKEAEAMQEPATQRATAEHFVEKAREYLRESYLPKIERAVRELSDEDIWWRAGEESNSIGNLLLHLDGSARMWIVSTVGGAPNLRERQQEFDARAPISRDELLARLRQTLAEVDATLAAVDVTKLLEKRRVWDEEVTALDAIFHAVEHFSMHAGQVIMLAKMRAGKDLRLSE